MTARGDALGARLGHHFSDENLLRRALTHASAGDAASSYERLEFLGDRVVGLVLAEILLARFPGEAEGDISRRHAKLVSRGA
ncbi:MAG: ribonuclease III domain-containing protein, partial [Thalassobaculaceae bacterium]